MSDSIPLGLRTTLRARYVALLMWCKACRHQAEADLQALVDAGKGDVPLKDLRFGAAGAAAISPRRDGEGDAADGALIRRTSSRNSASAASPRRRCSTGVMSGAAPNRPSLRLVVTMADMLTGAGASFAGSDCSRVKPTDLRGFALVTIGGTSNATALRFRGGRL